MSSTLVQCNFKKRLFCSSRKIPIVPSQASCHRVPHGSMKWHVQRVTHLSDLFGLAYVILITVLAISSRVQWEEPKNQVRHLVHLWAHVIPAFAGIHGLRCQPIQGTPVGQVRPLELSAGSIFQDTSILESHKLHVGKRTHKRSLIP